MDKLERFKLAFQHLKNNGIAHTQRDVAKKMGATPPNVSSAMKGDERYLTPNFLKRFNLAYGGIFNEDWLIGGNECAMLTTSDSNFRAEDSDSSEVITAKLVPLLPIAAQGGSLNDFIVSVKESECEKVVSPIKGVDFAMPISGDSMAPEYPNGSQIFIKKINERAFIEWGKVYVLDTCNGAVVKILVPSENEGYVKCLSINRDPIYAPFEIAWKDVYGVYRVLLCMSVK